MEPVNNLFVIEGSDGTGKTTQVKLMTERLRRAGYDVVVFSFPRYAEPSSHFIRSYLAGLYGDSKAVGPYAASLFYALDRYEAMPTIQKALEAGKIVLIDRYTASNLAHQGSKLTTPADRRGFYLWLDSLEHQILQLPRPAHSFVLYAPPTVTKQLLSKHHKDKASQPDIHEADLNHLVAATAAYDELCALFPQDFERIDCVRNGQLLAQSEITDLLWNRLQPLLPSPESTRQQRFSLPATTGPQQHDTSAGSIKLELPQVSQLVIQQLRLDNVTVRPILSTPATYYVPNNLPESLREEYDKTMRTLVTTAQRHLPESPVFAATLPLAILQDCTIEGDLDTIKQAIIELVASQLEELQNAGQRLFEQLYGLRNRGLSLQDVTIPLSTVEHRRTGKLLIDTSSQKFDNAGFGSIETGAKLIQCTPRNEIDLLPHLFYQSSNLSFNEILDATSKLDYKDKSDLLTDMLGAAPNDSLKIARYVFEVLAPLEIILRLKQLANKRVRVTVQPLTARYGFEVPSSLENQTLSEAYESSFDASFMLSSKLQAFDQTISSYALLLGHKVRASLQFTAAELRDFTVVRRKNSVVDQILSIIETTHPTIAARLLKD